MRGRKPRPLTIAADDLPVLASRRSEPALALVPGPACPHRPGRRRRRTGPRGCLADGVRPGHRLAPLSPLRAGRLDTTSVGRTPPRSSSRRSPPLQRAQIVELACLEPIAGGCISPTGPARTWPDRPSPMASSESISPRTVRQILHDVDLQPHRTRYWKTARLDAAVQGAGREGALVLRQRGAVGPSGPLGGGRR